MGLSIFHARYGVARIALLPTLLTLPILLALLGMLAACGDDEASRHSGPGVETSSVVFGRVVGDQEAPVAGAKVRLYDHAVTDGVALDSAQTGEDGRFEFDGLEAGNYHVEALIDTLGAQIPEFVLGAADSLDLGNIVLNIYITVNITINNTNNIQIVQILGGGSQQAGGDSTELTVPVSQAGGILYLLVQDSTGAQSVQPFQLVQQGGQWVLVPVGDDPVDLSAQVQASSGAGSSSGMVSSAASSSGAGSSVATSSSGALSSSAARSSSTVAPSSSAQPSSSVQLTSSAATSSSVPLSSSAALSSSGSLSSAGPCTGVALNAGEFCDERDGTVYPTALIGSQRWMARNLRYLPQVDAVADGSEDVASGPYNYVANYVPTGADEAAQVAAARLASDFASYGVLYNWYAAMAGAGSVTANPSGVRGVCPSGWHLPSDAEWEALASYVAGQVGGSLSGADWTGVGDALKTTTGWYNMGSGSDSQGFGAEPGGDRYYTGTFNDQQSYGRWWSATQSTGSAAYFREISHVNDALYRYALDKANGYAVRCVQD